MRKNFFLKNDVTLEGAVSYSDLYYQHLSPLIANKYVFMLTIIFSNFKTRVSSAFKGQNKKLVSMLARTNTIE